MVTNLRADAARNRERVLEVARAEVAEGNVSLQLNEIARKAGVGVGTVYRHFPTPRALLEAVVGKELATMVQLTEQASQMQDIRAAMEFLLRRTLDLQLCTSGGLAEVICAIEDADERTTHAKSEMRRLADHLLERARAAGVIRPEITGEDVRNLMAGLERAVELDPDRADVYVSVLIRGLSG
ncbi:TetR/AcrR family transcriptional regulator [Kibdelosporangium aridum]|uniref:Transcriptional regulator, TetR family n=1 Tax=Kibdelosporangium aridum TaxID=2030 RepID=A0A1Y5XN56_KIBAR|nr:TetR/AcrR family transcriptional regulator [Kibdelosporangium aridum]SMD08028.1 transcriptional regulator, TetR family [Kibdelosporangium aridum]